MDPCDAHVSPSDSLRVCFFACEGVLLSNFVAFHLHSYISMYMWNYIILKQYACDLFLVLSYFYYS